MSDDCNSSFILELFLHYKNNVATYVIVSANSDLECSFDDMEFCGYEDISTPGVNWAQIHTNCESVLFVEPLTCSILVVFNVVRRRGCGVASGYWEKSEIQHSNI